MPPTRTLNPGRQALRPLATLLVAALAVTVALLLMACGQKQDAKGAMTANQEAAATDAQAPAEPVVSASAQAAPTRTAVRVLELQPQDFAVSAVYVGHLLPRERVELRSELEGVVERVLFDAGKAVRQGELLANINTEQLRVRRDQAKADLALAERTHERDSALHDKQLVPDTQLEQSRTRRDLAKLTLQLAEIELQKSRVTSPLDGTVKTKGVERGEFLNKGQLIAEILDIRGLKAVFNVPERDVRFVRLGRQVRVTFEALPGDGFPGEVSLVGLEADLRTRTFPVEVRLDNAQGKLRPGMLARVTVELERFRNQILVPRHAILEREEGRVVFVVEDGLAAVRPVEVGASSGGQVQVLKGLSAGEQVVVTGHQKLTPGEPLDVRPAEPLPAGKP